MNRLSILLNLVLPFVITICGCSTDEREWRAAKRLNTIEAYGHYLGKRFHPKHEKEAECRLDTLKFKRACEINTVRTYHLYIDWHPKGAFISEAKSLIQKFDSIAVSVHQSYSDYGMQINKTLPFKEFTSAILEGIGYRVIEYSDSKFCTSLRIVIKGEAFSSSYLGFGADSPHGSLYTGVEMYCNITLKRPGFKPTVKQITNRIEPPSVLSIVNDPFNPLKISDWKKYKFAENAPFEECLGRFHVSRALLELFLSYDDRNRLTGLLRSGFERSVAKAVGSFLSVGDSGAVIFLDGLLYDNIEDCRANAALALGEIHTMRAAQLLVRALEHTGSDIVYFCLQDALLNIGNPAIEPLISVLEDKNRAGVAMHLLRIITKHDPSPPREMADGKDRPILWKEWWEKNKDRF